MKKIITIEYEPNSETPSCDECPFYKTNACEYLERIGLACENVNIKDVTIKDD